MHNLTPTQPLDDYEDDLVYLDASLQADDLTAKTDLPAKAQAGLAKVEAVNAEHKKRRRAQVKVDALAAAKRRKLKSAWTAALKAVLKAADLDRKNPLYAKYVTKAPPSKIASGDLGKFVQAARAAGDLLAKEADPALKKFAAPLLAAVAAVEKVEPQQAAAAAANQQHDKTDRQPVRTATNKLRQSVHASLEHVRIEAGEEKGWSDTFFRPAAKTRKVAPTTPPAP